MVHIVRQVGYVSWDQVRDHQFYGGTLCQVVRPSTAIHFSFHSRLRLDLALASSITACTSALRLGSPLEKLRSLPKPLSSREHPPTFFQM